MHDQAGRPNLWIPAFERYYVRYSTSFLKVSVPNLNLRSNSIVHFPSGTSRQSSRRNQILRNFIPRKNRALKLLRMSWKLDLQLRRVTMGNHLDLHDDPAISSHRGFDRNFVAILIFCLCHIEYGEDRRDNNEDCSIDKVTSGTDSLHIAKHK